MSTTAERAKSFEASLFDAVATRWAGSTPFTIDIFESVMSSARQDLAALEALWRFGQLDLDKLADRIGSDFCAVDSARARGEYKRKREPSRKEIVRRRLRRLIA